jgi:hypothetical protein
MRPFTNNKGTSSAIFYNRGVPKSDKMFAYLATQNYTVMKQLAIYNRKNIVPLPVVPSPVVPSPVVYSPVVTSPVVSSPPVVPTQPGGVILDNIYIAPVLIRNRRNNSQTQRSSVSFSIYL